MIVGSKCKNLANDQHDLFEINKKAQLIWDIIFVELQ